MSTDYNRIKVADLETNERDKILATNENGELEFRNLVSSTNDIAIQDSLGVEKFKTSDYIRFKGVSFNENVKQIEINPLVSGVIFVSNTTGNDATAEIENRGKPFKTINAAIAAYWSNTSIDYIEIIDASTYTLSASTTDFTTRKFELRSQKACIVNVATTLQYSVNSQSYIINMPNASIVYNPTVATANTWKGANITIIASTCEFGLNYKAVGDGSGTFFVTTDNLMIRTTTGIISVTGGNRVINIKTTNLNFRGAGALLCSIFVGIVLDFSLLTHDNTFAISVPNTRSTTVDHGTVTSIAPYTNATNINYLWGRDLTLRYKTGAVVNSNLTINKFNVSGACIISGIVSLPNSAYVVAGCNNPGVSFINATITCKSLIGGNSNVAYVEIVNCYINIMGTYLMSYSQAGGGSTYVNPTLEFKGNNFVIGATDGFNLTLDEPLWVATNNPTIEITKGILYTNGKFNKQKVIIKQKFLNQYNDAVIDNEL